MKYILISKSKIIFQLKDHHSYIYRIHHNATAKFTPFCNRIHPLG